ncbi:TetR family transcriptional regulator [Companilactobacillus mindensis DSM 14500]|uniref:TetR family transcriptional regulator n=1 Tax=Companilactobacillus mindensis DSM 14500 TaxID=1423770 RepID=A0A0R1QTQ3_9LACO|nr:TetR/AcrR family transcriptional regulator [Companilactobacillus mindensis]KRL45866.1 TetR family transcriptional regulator [Companilactobacillus mindensis DSM 14500]GEO77727.1 TetR family transcriptional regulator [Companilactobacillus mindensis]
MENAFEDVGIWLTNTDMPHGKKQVIKASLKLFSEQGYDGTSTAQIAKSSGMSQATIFKYFKSKEDLLLFIIEPIIEHILPAYGKEFATDVAQNNQSLNSLIHFIITNRFNFLVQNKDAAIILFSQVMINDKVKDLLLKKIASLKGMFVKNIWQVLQETGEMRTDIDMIQFVRLVASQLYFYFLQSQRIIPTADKAQIQTDLSNIENMILRAVRK